MFAVAAGTAPAADVRPLEVREYREDFDVSALQAEETLEIQADGAEADAAGDLEGRLGSSYAGLWFDNEKGEFVVPILGKEGAEAARVELAVAGIDGSEYRVTAAESSWAELEAAQEKLNEALAQPMAEGLLQTMIDPRTNSVVVREASGIEGPVALSIRELARTFSVNVEVRQREVGRFTPTPAACKVGGKGYVNCDTPLRGGVGIGKHEQAGECTAGFKATGLATGNRYVLTAGHCAINPYVGEWDAYDSSEAEKFLGFTESAYWGSGGHDIAKIRVNGTKWDVSPWPTQVIEWNESTYAVTNSAHPITSESNSYVGEYACFTGIETGTNCGSVKAMNITVSDTFEGLFVVVNHLTELAPVCNATANSGGPVFAGNVALGITSFADDRVPVSECSKKNYNLYSEITEDTDYLGVTVAPRTNSQTFIDQAAALNGNPGWVTVKGHVTVPGSPVSGKSIKIKLFKWENNNWALKAEPLGVTVTNGNFELKNWNGVGPGSWMAKAEFPAQTPYGASSSNTATEGSFTVRDGYQIVAGHSNRCMDVKETSRENNARIWQWDCLNPTTGQNQVFKLVPNGEGNFQIVARLSNRCVSVIGASKTLGMALEQYDCLGPYQPGQVWRVQPTAVSNVVKFIAVHSGQCMDVQGQKPEREIPYTQWECLNQANQLFSLVSVDAGPAPTQTYLTVPEDERLSGEYGYVTGQGNVKAGGYPLAGQTVELTYEKEASPGNWKVEHTTYPLLNSEGFYQYKYQPVGVGNWRMKAKYLGKGGELAASSSPGYVNFHIGWGFRLVARHSNKCMSIPINKANGLQFNQWTCSAAPWPGDGQVFTFVPQDNGAYFLILTNANSTPQLGKCLDVAAASTGDGAAINQWDCGGSNNQKWQKVPIAGQAPWVAFIAKHSGKCIDVWQQSQANGAGIHQWGCFWPGSQQWKMESVG